MSAEATASASARPAWSAKTALRADREVAWDRVRQAQANLRKRVGKSGRAATKSRRSLETSNYQRWYRPNDGRYLSPDPIGLAGGEAGYSAYAGGNPLVLSDPMGLARKNPNQPVCGVGQEDCDPNPLVPDESNEPPPPPPPEEEGGFGGGRYIFGDRGISTGGGSGRGAKTFEEALRSEDCREMRGEGASIKQLEDAGCPVGDNAEVCAAYADRDYKICRAQGTPARRACCWANAAYRLATCIQTDGLKFGRVLLRGCPP
jgi:RHS repeat-associated protein